MTETDNRSTRKITKKKKRKIIDATENYLTFSYIKLGFRHWINSV